MLKLRFALPAIAAALFCCHVSLAQAPAGAPAGSTGQCKDGTYSTAATKSGACRGHQGVKQWFTASAAAPAKAAPAPAAAPQSSTTMMMGPAPSSKPAKSMPAPSATAAPGGGPNMVWVNTASNVYHCPSDRYYGKTKAGKYMTEADAKAAGAHGQKGETCFK